MLVDAKGNIDILEIKKPKERQLISKSSSNHRGNFIPTKELSEAIMQVEKYLFHLNKWGKKGEDELNKKYKNKLPNSLKINITNPRGIIILGRDEGLTNNERLDFEIIKRKYTHIADIITYDDLLKRLENIINSLKARID